MTTVSDTTLAALIAGLGTPAVAEQRCQITEQLTTECAHCRLTPEEKTEHFSSYFPATYDGKCAGCGRSFDLFDLIRSDGAGGWLATCCGGPDQPPTTSLAAPVRPPMVSGPPPSTVTVMRDVLADLDASRPRSRQRTLGPSELGTPCQRQIGMKLAGVPRQLPDSRPPWAPMQGTAMHVLMEEALGFHNAQLGRPRWVIEDKLQIDDEVAGHGDAFDTDTGTVVDWKYVGVTTLRDVKRKKTPNAGLVKPEYRTQAHLYGLGHARAGRDVRWVRLVFLARSHNYDDSAEWTEAYDPAIAQAALDRYHATKTLITALDLAAQPSLWGVVPAAPGKACDWCPFRRPGGPADATGCPGNLAAKAEKQLHGLLA